MDSNAVEDAERIHELEEEISSLVAENEELTNIIEDIRVDIQAMLVDLR